MHVHLVKHVFVYSQITCGLAYVRIPRKL